MSHTIPKWDRKRHGTSRTYRRAMHLAYLRQGANRKAQIQARLMLLSWAVLVAVAFAIGYSARIWA